MGISFAFPFSPGLGDPAALEAVFVQRRAVADRIVSLILESARTASKHQQLLVGGPGLGKTHLVTLVVHRLQRMEENQLKIAWLGEEISGIQSFLDLLMHLLECVGTAAQDRFKLDGLYDLNPEEAELEAGERLVKTLGGQTLLMVVENLQELFESLGESGQHRLRAFMQENPFITTLATARGLFDGVSKRTEPFYGTFSIDHLLPLNEDETVQMLYKTADHHNDPDLAEFLDSPEGKARVRAFHHLAGGNHRVCTLFARHLTRDDLDELVGPALGTLDDLTPGCRAWVAALPRQPRKILHLLCRHGSGITVKEIARRCFLKHQTVSSQLKLLRDRGYVRATSVGRDAYYEVRDPLMRLCITMKLDQGRAVRNLITFLRDWHGDRESKDQAAEEVGALLVDQSTPEVRFQQAKEMLAFWEEQGDLSALAQGLVRNISQIKNLLLSAESARLWLGVWKEAAGGNPEMHLSLKLLDTAVRALEKPGPEALLDLAAEERPILKNLI
ncbi:MAG: MarR family transcriptional regulator [Planctomycetes bacterium]|nr:MarR family transcriptional regulator [Planctomycetota bacterium]